MGMEKGKTKAACIFRKCCKSTLYSTELLWCHPCCRQAQIRDISSYQQKYNAHEYCSSYTHSLLILCRDQIAPVMIMTALPWPLQTHKLPCWQNRSEIGYGIKFFLWFHNSFECCRLPSRNYQILQKYFAMFWRIQLELA